MISTTQGVTPMRAAGRRRPIDLGLAAVLAVAVLAGATGPTRTAATSPGAPGVIAIGCAAGLWTVRPDGDNLLQVTDEEVTTPDWSPGGTMLAFTRSASDGHAGLWLMDADGGDPFGVAEWVDREVRDPSWFADGSEIGFSTDQTPRTFPARHLRSLRPQPINGTGRYLGHLDGVPLHDPAFSPDWQRLAVVGAIDGAPSEGIWLTGPWWTPDEVVQTTVPPAGSSDRAPDWAPTGDRYVFVRDDGSGRSVFAVDADGTDLVRLTDETQDAISPTYSGDGTRIAFLARPAAEIGTDAPFDLWTIDSSGSDPQLVLAEAPCDHIDWQPVPAFPLIDAQFSDFERHIEWAFAEGITAGCTAERFCDRDHVPRDQLASFIARAWELPPAMEDYFTDDANSTHEGAINRIAEAGFASGCAEDRFCPTRRVSRAEIASFLVRVLDLPPATLDYFTDDDGSTHEDGINRLAQAGLTSGCAPMRYCPDRSVTRGELMALLHRAIGD